MNTRAYQQIARGGGGGLPKPPTRDQICRVICSMQGLTFQGRHWWDPALTDPSMTKAQRLAFYPQTSAEGNTHVSLSLDGVYGQPQQGLESLTRILPIMREAIVEGGLTGILLNCKGDGNGDPNYTNFDPGSLGFHWLMANFAEIVKRVEDAGLKPFTVFSPGFDGVIPGWQPFTRVNDYAQMAREVVGPDGYLAIEPSSGYWSWSGEQNDWATEDGQKFDVILYEGPIESGPPDPPDPAFINEIGGQTFWKDSTTNEQRAPWDQVWQIIGRLVQPYHRPADQPANDDAGGAPYALGGGTPRGRFYLSGYEFGTYPWIRLQDFPVERIRAWRQALVDLGVEIVC